MVWFECTVYFNFTNNYRNTIKFPCIVVFVGSKSHLLGVSYSEKYFSFVVILQLETKAI